MHEAVKDFIKQVKAKYPSYFINKYVIEFGSLDINGTPKEFFKDCPDCKYYGVDWRAGPGVDHVCLAHKYNPLVKFNVVISTEMLEHDKFAKESVENMVRLLDSNGLLIITCAGPLRKEHEQECGVDNHYANIQPTQLESWIDKKLFKEFKIEVSGKDIQLYAIKR